MSRVAENKKGEVTAQFNRFIAQLLAALVDALRAAGHPEQERRAVLQADADAFDEAGLPGLSQMFRDPQATPPTPKRKTFSSKDQVQQRPGDEQDKGNAQRDEREQNRNDVHRQQPYWPPVQ